MVKCSSDTDKAHISESSATVIEVLLLLQYHCPPNLELHQHLSRACAGQFLVSIKIFFVQTSEPVCFKHCKVNKVVSQEFVESSSTDKISMPTFLAEKNANVRSELLQCKNSSQCFDKN